MTIGKSRISDLNFGSFENTIDKNIEADKASDKFDKQLQAYKDAGDTLASAIGGVETAAAFIQEAKDKLDQTTEKAEVVTKAIETYIDKVKNIAVKARVDDADMEKVINCRKKLVEDESQLLKDHRKDYKDILIRHFYDMSNMMSKTPGATRQTGRMPSGSLPPSYACQTLDRTPYSRPSTMRTPSLWSLLLYGGV